MSTRYTFRPMAEISGRTVFAEEARPEVSGQFSIVGVLAGGIASDVFPILMPKLALIVEYQQLEGVEPLEVRLAAFMPGASANEPFWEHAHGVEAWVNFLTPSDENPGPYPFPSVRRITQVVNLASVEIPKPGVLQVRAFRDGEVISLGGLDVRRVQP